MTDRWPEPADLPVDRARRIANTLLAMLPDDQAADLTAAAHAHGETWLGSTLMIYTPDRAITTRQAAELLAVSEAVIRRWACLPHPEDPSRRLLPRNGRLGGRQQTYLVRNLLDAAIAVRRAREHRRKAT